MRTATASFTGAVVDDLPEEVVDSVDRDRMTATRAAGWVVVAVVVSFELVVLEARLEEARSCSAMEECLGVFALLPDFLPLPLTKRSILLIMLLVGNYASNKYSSVASSSGRGVNITSTVNRPRLGSEDMDEAVKQVS